MIVSAAPSGSASRQTRPTPGTGAQTRVRVGAPHEAHGYPISRRPDTYFSVTLEKFGPRLLPNP